VPNGSFEEYSDCPESREVGNGQFTRCNDWWYPTYSGNGSPDYFHSCNNSIGGVNQGLVGVPASSMGFQNAFHGEGYLGFIPIGVYNQSNAYEVLEPFSCRLKEPLKPCGVYKFRCYVSLAAFSTYSLDGLGIVCSEDSLILNSFSDVYELEETWESEVVVSDSANWTLLEGTFEAKGDEKFLTFGYFKSDEETNWQVHDTVNDPFDARYAYYFVDSMSLLLIDETEVCANPIIPNVFSPNNDGLNDSFSIAGLGLDKLTILNRWGNVIALLDANNTAWDGSIGGNESPDGTYFYIAEYLGRTLQGFIQLVR